MAFAVLFVSLATLTATAQTPTNKPNEKSNANPGAKRLFVVAEAAPTKKVSDVTKMINFALNELKKNDAAFQYGRVSVQPIASSVYKGMKALLRGETFDPVAASTGLGIRLVAGAHSTWEISTGDPFARAKEITVHFEQEENGKVSVVAPPMKFPASPIGAKDQPFRFHSPGTYVLSLSSEHTPSRYEIELISDTPGAVVKSPVSGAWPLENQYFLLLIDGFVGEQKDLFEMLKRNEVVGDGLEDVQTAETATISLATFVEAIDPDYNGWEDAKHYRVFFKKPNNKFPNRVWLYFPADAETAKAEMARLKSICNRGADEHKQLLNTIRKSAVLATHPSTLKAGATPSWYEIPLDAPLEGEKNSRSLSRVFEVQPPTGGAASAGPTFGLSIFDFKDELILRVGNSHVQQVEHPRWAEGVQKLTGTANP